MMQPGVERSLSTPGRVPRQESHFMDGVCTSSSVVMPVLLYLEMLLAPSVLKNLPFIISDLCLSPILDSCNS